MNIVTCKMITGEEVVSDYTDNGNGFSTLSNPRTFQVIQDERGQVRAGLVPWFMSDPNAEVFVSAEHIIASIESTKELADAYIQQTTKLDLSAANPSGIVVS